MGKSNLTKELQLCKKCLEEIKSFSNDGFCKISPNNILARGEILVGNIISEVPLYNDTIITDKNIFLNIVSVLDYIELIKTGEKEVITVEDLINKMKITDYKENFPNLDEIEFVEQTDYSELDIKKIIDIMKNNELVYENQNIRILPKYLGRIGGYTKALSIYTSDIDNGFKYICFELTNHKQIKSEYYGKFIVV